MFGGDKTGISWFFFQASHCEQADHHPAMQRHLEKIEAIEVLNCTSALYNLNQLYGLTYFGWNSNYCPIKKRHKCASSGHLEFG